MANKITYRTKEWLYENERRNKTERMSILREYVLIEIMRYGVGVTEALRFLRWIEAYMNAQNAGSVLRCDLKVLQA